LDIWISPLWLAFQFELVLFFSMHPHKGQSSIRISSGLSSIDHICSGPQNKTPNQFN